MSGISEKVTTKKELHKLEIAELEKEAKRYYKMVMSKKAIPNGQQRLIDTDENVLSLQDYDAMIINIAKMYNVKPIRVWLLLIKFHGVRLGINYDTIPKKYKSLLKSVTTNNSPIKRLLPEDELVSNIAKPTIDFGGWGFGVGF